MAKVQKDEIDKNMTKKEEIYNYIHCRTWLCAVVPGNRNSGRIEKYK